MQQLEEKKRALSRLEDENRGQIRDAAIAAYSNLESVVSELVAIPHGNTRLSRESPAISDKLKEAADRFQKLSDVSRQNVQELGTGAGDCMNMGDRTANFISSLDGRVTAWNIEHNAIWGQMRSHENELNEYRGREGGLRDQVNSARSSQDVRPVLPISASDC